MIEVRCFVDGKQKFLFKCKDAPQARMCVRRFIEEQEQEFGHQLHYFLDAMTALRLALDGDEEVKHGVSNGHSAVCFEKKADEKPKGPARPFVVTAENWPEDMEDDCGCIPAVVEKKGSKNADMNWCILDKSALPAQNVRYWCGGFPTSDDMSAAPWPEDEQARKSKIEFYIEEKEWSGFIEIARLWDALTVEQAAEIYHAIDQLQEYPLSRTPEYLSEKQRERMKEVWTTSNGIKIRDGLNKVFRLMKEMKEKGLLKVVEDEEPPF